MNEMTNLVLAANAIIHPYHIPGKELLSPKYKTKYEYVEEGTGMKVIHNGHAIFVRTEHDANGPHIQFCIAATNNEGEIKWLPVGIGKIKDGVAVLEPLSVDEPVPQYNVSKETWQTYKEMMADTMRMLILYASICRIRYGLPIFDINHYWTTQTLHRAIFPEDRLKKEENKAKSEETVEKTEIDALKEFAEALKKIEKEINSLKEAKKNDNSEENYQKWREETNEFIMKVIKTREIPAKNDENDENALKCADIFVRINRAVREFCSEAYSMCSQSSNNISFTETINASSDISDERFVKLLPKHRAEPYIATRKENELIPDKYKVSCIIESAFTGAVKYTFRFSDAMIYKKGIDITFNFNKDMELVNVRNTMNEFGYLKLHPVFQYISQFSAGPGVHLTHKIAHLCGDIQKKINAEEKENGKEGK